MKAVAIAIAIISVAIPVFAGPPISGVYKSSLGDFDEGRQGTAWIAPDFLATSQVLHGQSWDGVALGGDWEILCPQAIAVTLLVDLVSGGNGHRIYQIDYAGGFFKLGGGGPWGNGDPNYLGPMDTCVEIRTVTYANGERVGSISDHSVSAHLQGYTQTCVTWAIGNGVWLGDSAVAPANYPGYHDSSCNPTSTQGHYGDITDLTLSIDGCSLPTKSATWGSVKAMYRN